MSRRYPSDKLLTPSRPGPSIEAQYAWRLLEAVPDIAFVKDTTLHYQFVNQALADLVSLPVIDILGQTDGDLFEDELAETFRAQDEQVLRGDTVEALRPWERPDGVITLQVVKAPLRSSQGQIIGVAGLARDVSTFETDKAAKRELEQKLLEAQKLESLSLMAGGIAHDFNNLLAAILGNAELALQVVPTDSSAHDCLKDIREAASRAAGLSRQMLAFSGRGVMALHEIHLNEELEQLHGLFETTLSKKASLVYELAGSLPRVRGDVRQIRQLVLNLLTNASEALPEGRGTITVRTDVVYWDQVQLAATYLGDELPPGEYVQLTVSDDGCGMDGETLAKVFEPFYSRKFHGRGLGMAAALGIVRGHKGAIVVESVPDRGTTVTVALPVYEPEPQPRRARARLRTPSGTFGGTVLVVDDEPAVLSVAQRLLDRGGFTTLAAPNGVAALEILERYGQDIGLVLLDLTMPEMDGNETYARLRERFPDLPVILVSGYSESEVAVKFTGEGLAGFIQKPYHPTRLLRQVHRSFKS